jgi:hypothetical protein
MKYGTYGWIVMLLLTGSSLTSSAAGDGLPVAADTLSPQKNEVKKTFSEKMDVTIEKIFRYAPLPAVGYSTETSWYFGLVKYNAFKISSRQLPDSLVKNSKVIVAGTYSLNKQYSFTADLDLVHGGNRWNTFLKFSVKGFPSIFYGVGNDTRKEDGVLTDFRNISFSPGVNYGLSCRNFVGIKYTFNNYTRVVPLDSVPDETPYRENEGIESGIGIRYFFDSRDHRVQTERGLYLFTSFDVVGKFLGSGFDFHTFTVDLRGFVTPWPRVTLAGQLYTRAQGGEVPVQSLAFVGGHSLLRGFYARRFREKSSFVLQGDVRFPIFWIISGVAYGGMGQVAPRYGEMKWSGFHYAGGAGLRILFDKRSRSAVRLDVSFSNEGHTIYIGFGEAF